RRRLRGDGEVAFLAIRLQLLGERLPHASIFPEASAERKIFRRPLAGVKSARRARIMAIAKASAQRSTWQAVYVRDHLLHAFFSGVVAGQLAALGMTIFLALVFSISLGTEAYYPIQALGALFYGDAALNGFHAGAFAAGIAFNQLTLGLLW